MVRASTVRTALGDHEHYLDELKAANAEASLYAYQEFMWPVLEKGRRMIKGWPIEGMCEHLEALARGDIRRLLLNVPPGFSKSTSCNAYFPSWMWGPQFRAITRWLSWSYDPQLTIRDNLKFRRLILSERFQRFWGHSFNLAGDQNQKTLVANDQTGFKFATGIHGGTTGHRGDFRMIDDPHNTKQAESDVRREETVQIFRESILSRGSDEDAEDDSPICVIMQRLNERDVSGAIIAEELQFEHFCVPMRFEEEHFGNRMTCIGWKDPRTEEGELAWPERFGSKKLDLREKAMGEFAVAGQHQQRPKPRGGGMLKRGDFRLLDEEPLDGVCARGWDLAATSKAKNPNAAYTAGVRMKLTPDNRIIICDVVRVREEPDTVETIIAATAAEDAQAVQQDIPQDPGAAGKAWKLAIGKRLVGYTCHFSTEAGAKESRAGPFASQLRLGNVFLVRAPWNEAYLREASSFPGPLKDQIDATSRALARLLIMAQNAQTDFAAPQLYEDIASLM